MAPHPQRNRSAFARSACRLGQVPHCPLVGGSGKRSRSPNGRTAPTAAATRCPCPPAPYQHWQRATEKLRYLMTDRSVASSGLCILVLLLQAPAGAAGSASLPHTPPLRSGGGLEVLVRHHVELVHVLDLQASMYDKVLRVMLFDDGATCAACTVCAMHGVHACSAKHVSATHARTKENVNDRGARSRKRTCAAYGTHSPASSSRLRWVLTHGNPERHTVPGPVQATWQACSDDDPRATPYPLHDTYS